MKDMKSKVTDRLRKSVEKKYQWKRELEMEYAAKGEKVKIELI